MVGESELSGLDALVDCFVEFKNMDAALTACARNQGQSWMEDDLLNVSLTVTSLQLLHAIATIRAKQFYDVSSATS